MLLPSNFRTTTALDQLSVRYANDQTKYAALKIFQPFIVPRNVGKFYCHDKQNLRSEILDAPSGTESPRFDYQVSTKNFACKEYGAKHLVLGKDARDFDRPVADLRTDAALSNMDKMLIALEVAAYTKISTTGNYAAANTAAAGAVWSGNTGDPIEEIRTARQAVWASSGVRANCICMSQQALDYLKNHAAIVDRLKYVGMGAVNSAEAVKQAIGNLFELEIIISDALKLTSAEGATDVTAAIWGATALIFVNKPGQGLKTMTYGRNFIANSLTTKSINKPELARGNLGAEEIETSWEYDLQFIAQDANGDADAGYLLTTLY